MQRTDLAERESALVGGVHISPKECTGTFAAFTTSFRCRGSGARGPPSTRASTSTCAAACPVLAARTRTRTRAATRRRAPRPTLPRHLAPHALSICASAAPRPPVCPFASASHPYLRRPSPLPPRRCMLRSISRKKSLSFNHRHLNCFIYVLSYVAKLEDPQRGA